MAGEHLAVVLDMQSNPALESEGLAREVVSRIQQIRRELSFDVSDRIRVEWWSDDQSLADAWSAHDAYIRAEILAISVQRAGSPLGAPLDLDGRRISLRLEKA
jgi:isoleucyl-tRNA synthetase